MSYIHPTFPSSYSPLDFSTMLAVAILSLVAIVAAHPFHGRGVAQVISQCNKPNTAALTFVRVHRRSSDPLPRADTLWNLGRWSMAMDVSSHPVRLEAQERLNSL